MPVPYSKHISYRKDENDTNVYKNVAYVFANILQKRKFFIQKTPKKESFSFVKEMVQ